MTLAGIGVLNSTALGHLMPMHVICNAVGEIGSWGPSFPKLFPDTVLNGFPLLDLVELRRPPGAASADDLADCVGQPLLLRGLAGSHCDFKGIVVELEGSSGYLLNLSPYGDLTGAVQRHCLTISDFAPTDHVPEMLYILEAKVLVHDEIKRMNGRLAAAKRSAEEQALTDTLTGLGNLRAMERCFDELERGRIPFAIIQLDLDRFKQVNDRFGHAVGDELLQRVADVLVRNVRAEDLIIRSGGDEFTIVIRSTGILRSVAFVAQRIVDRLCEPFDISVGKVTIGASAGVAMAGLSLANSPTGTRECADAVLYRAKSSGGGRVIMAGSEQHLPLPRVFPA